jgi:hypothetical protein
MKRRRRVARPVAVQVYLVSEVARKFRTSPGAIYRAIERGEVPVLRLGPGAAKRIPAVWVDEQLRSGSAKATSK